MIGAIGANVAGNIIAQPLLNGMQSQPAYAYALPPEPSPYGSAAASASPGIYIGQKGSIVLIKPKVGLTYTPSLGAGLMGSNGSATESNGPAATVAVVPETSSETGQDMTTWMLVGAAAGAGVAKYHGYNLLIGAAAGALIGHLYAAGAYK
jgi:hypothetical protein